MLKTIWVSIFSLIYLLVTVQPSHATEVVGDNEIVAYIGTGGLLLPTTFTGTATTKKAVADCVGCTWAYSVFCMNDLEGLCQHSTATCSLGQVRYRVWFGRSKDELEVIGSVCWGIGRPPTRRDAETRVKDLVVNYVPQLQLTLAPPGGSLTVIPVIGWVDQPQTYSPPAFNLSGRKVTITAKATWRWIWGDGTIEWKSVPGEVFVVGRDLESQIQHQYRIPNEYLVEVTTIWSATYQVDGIGAFKVGGEVLTQTAQELIRIRSAGSVLLKN